MALGLGLRPSKSLRRRGATAAVMVRPPLVQVVRESADQILWWAQANQLFLWLRWMLPELWRQRRNLICTVTPSDGESDAALVCAACERESEGSARGWQAHRTDDEIAVYCPGCARPRSR